MHEIVLLASFLCASATSNEESLNTAQAEEFEDVVLGRQILSFYPDQGEDWELEDEEEDNLK